jgi:hypothetical protein
MKHMPRPWTAREREFAETGVLARGYIDIRVLTYKRESAGDPATALRRIQMIADACHNLPGAARRRHRGGGLDPFVSTWQMAKPDQREWLAEVFQSLRLDTAWLDNAPLKRPPDVL